MGLFFRSIIPGPQHLGLVMRRLQGILPLLTLGLGHGQVTHRFISFDDITPAGMDKTQCWNALGMDDRERVYIGWTSFRPDRKEDFLVFRYDPASGERLYLGSFMGASSAAGNLEVQEEIPKGHTHMHFIEGKVYMGSQGFHDFKQGITDLTKYRGSHLYAYDVAGGRLEDLSKDFPGGIITRNQGLLALSHSPWRGLLVGLTHPLGDMVLYDYRQNRIQATVPGIPWKLGNPVSREVVVTRRGKIYTYRGTEDPAQRNAVNPVWVYDMATGTLENTGFTCTQGFWNGQTMTKDGNTIFVATVQGELYALDVPTDTWRRLGYFLPKADYDRGMRITYLYGITLSPDEKVIYAVPAATTNPSRPGMLYQYHRETGQVTAVRALGQGGAGLGVYTGSNLRDSRGNIYFAAFGTANDIFNRQCRLAVIQVGGNLPSGLRTKASGAGSRWGSAREPAGPQFRPDGREVDPIPRSRGPAIRLTKP